MFSITTHHQDSSDKMVAYIIKITALEMSLALSRHVKFMDGPLYCRLHWLSITHLWSTTALRLGNTIILGSLIHNV
jgi:hypothetical protein